MAALAALTGLTGLAALAVLLATLPCLRWLRWLRCACHDAALSRSVLQLLSCVIISPQVKYRGKTACELLLFLLLLLP
jgi:apolipoprotein N-acyltransferase